MPVLQIEYTLLMHADNPATAPAPDAERIRNLIEAGRLADAIAAADRLLDGAGATDGVQLLSLKSLALVSAGQAMDGLRVAHEAHDRARTDTAPSAAAEALLAIGFALQAMEDHARAIDVFTQAERIAKQADDPHLLARALRRLGISCSVLGQHAQAESILGEAATLLAAHGSVAEACHARFSILNARSRALDALPGDAAAKSDRYRQLYDDWQAFADEMSQQKLTRLEAMATGNSGIAARHTGDWPLALTVLGRAATLQAAAGLRGHHAVTVNHVGAILLGQGRTAEAIAELQRGIELLAGGNPRDLMEAWEALAEAHEQADDPRAALAAYKKARSEECRLRDDDARLAAIQREQRNEIARLAGQWARIAGQDALTGIANRRAFDDAMQRLIDEARSGAVRSLLVIDLDHFKRINDTFGHATGDLVLQRFGALLGEGRRSGDLPARIGGEEFALLLPCSLADAVEVAARIASQVRHHDWRQEADGLAVTISIGAACAGEFEPDAMSARSLFALADRRLYAAKEGGRDQVCWSDTADARRRTT